MIHSFDPGHVAAACPLHLMARTVATGCVCASCALAMALLPFMLAQNVCILLRRKQKLLGSGAMGPQQCPLTYQKIAKKARWEPAAAACRRCAGKRNGSVLRAPGSLFRAMGKNEREKGPAEL